MRESIVEDYLVKRVESMRGEVRKVRWIGRRHAPDRVVMLPACRCGALPSFTAWPELKATGKAARAGQQREHKRMRDVGQVVVVINSLKGVDDFLKDRECSSTICCSTKSPRGPTASSSPTPISPRKSQAPSP